VRAEPEPDGVCARDVQDASRAMWWCAGGMGRWMWASEHAGSGRWT
jgi:hypothetical protein